jgi:hypothetical protein
MKETRDARTNAIPSRDQNALARFDRRNSREEELSAVIAPA